MIDFYSIRDYEMEQMKHDPKLLAQNKIWMDGGDWVRSLDKYSWTLEIDERRFADVSYSNAMRELRSHPRVNTNTRGVHYATIPLTLDGAWLEDNILATNETLLATQHTGCGDTPEEREEDLKEFAEYTRDWLLHSEYRLGLNYMPRGKKLVDYKVFEAPTNRASWWSNDQWDWRKAAVPVIKAFMTKERCIIINVVMLYGNVEFPTVQKTIEIVDAWMSKQDEMRNKCRSLLESGEADIDKWGQLRLKNAPAFEDVPGNGAWSVTCGELGFTKTTTSAEVDRRLITQIEGKTVADLIGNRRHFYNLCIEHRTWHMLSDDPWVCEKDPCRSILPLPEQWDNIDPMSNAMNFGTMAPEDWAQKVHEFVRIGAKDNMSIFCKLWR